MSSSGKPAAAAAAFTVLGFTPVQIVDLVGTIAGAFVPGAQLLGMSIEAITKLASGVAAEVPEAIAAVDEIKAVAAAGADPTPAQWADWNAAADAAHVAAQAAWDKVIAEGAGKS